MFSTFFLAIYLVVTGSTIIPPTDSTDTINKNKLLQLINDTRKKGCRCGDSFYKPGTSLAWNDQLANAAMIHSKDMSSKNFFSHDSPSGSTPGDRIKKAGYAWINYGENIGLGYLNEEDMVKGWLKSPGHCRNLMGKQFKDIGVARAGNYWTADFGTK